jgi:hypothetical protein
MRERGGTVVSSWSTNLPAHGESHLMEDGPQGGERFTSDCPHITQVGLLEFHPEKKEKLQIKDNPIGACRRSYIRDSR